MYNIQVSNKYTNILAKIGLVFEICTFKYAIILDKH